MALTSTAELIDSLKHYDNIIAWLNDTLQTFDGTPSQPAAELNDLDQQITNLLATLDIASEDTSTQVEQIIDDVSRSIPRLTYDLHFLKDNAVSLQAALTKIQQTSKDVVPQDTTDALNSLSNYTHRIRDSMAAPIPYLTWPNLLSTMSREKVFCIRSNLRYFSFSLTSSRWLVTSAM